MENLVHHRNSKAIVRIYEPIRLLPDVPLKPFLIPDAIKVSHSNAILLGISYITNITLIYALLYARPAYMDFFFFLKAIKIFCERSLAHDIGV